MDFGSFIANMIEGPFFLEFVKWVYPIESTPRSIVYM